MTFDRLFPTLYKVLHARVEPGIWPGSTQVTAAGEMLIGGTALSAVAAAHGTPVLVLDPAEVRHRCAAYRTALPAAETAFTVAALPHPEVLRWIIGEGLSLAVAAPAELAAARTAGCPAARIIAHRMPAAVGADTVVVRSLAEIDRAAAGRGRRDVLIRVAAETGGPGFRIDDGAATAAVRRLLAVPGVRPVGVHCHLGSSIGRISRYEAATRRLLALLAAIRDELGVTLARLNLGGGHAVARTPGAPFLDLPGLGARLTAVLAYETRALALLPPALVLEPGRAITGPAGVGLHRVLGVTSDEAVLDSPLDCDGPLAADNRLDHSCAGGHQVRLVGRVPGPRRPFRVTGATHAVPLPEDLRAGDLLAAACAGAYPARPGPTPVVVAVADGAARALSTGVAARPGRAGR
jgi:diaminopimelate decarboxylase